MSNEIRYDSLLVRALVRELHERLMGRIIHALLLDAQRMGVALRVGSETLLWHLGATGGLRWIDERVAGNIALPRPSIVRDVSTPPDERTITFQFRPAGAADQLQPRGAAADDIAHGEHRLVLELMAPRWNAIAVSPSGMVSAVLRPRTGGKRPLAPGLPWAAPPPRTRAGAIEPLPLAEWRALLSPLPPPERRSALLESVAYTSPLNASHILGDAESLADEEAIERAFGRYRALLAHEKGSACVLALEHGAQPYPVPLDEANCTSAPTLIRAFELASDAPDRPVAPAQALALDNLRPRLEQLEARLARLRDELDGAGADADDLRRKANLLLSQLHHVRKGEPSASLDDFAGGTVTLGLDPSLTPADNARRLYDAARKRERAAKRLPAVIATAEREAARLRQRIERIEHGVEPLPAPAQGGIARSRKSRAAAGPRPYRQYLTSGGLEVRVGRGARSNDELTLRHSSPDDIWLHARDVGGAHVVLRWSDREVNPPAGDLVEAAVLAALHSRARTSTTVPVDWTRRKYVRKPRKSKPGTVLLERAKTLFVQPDASLERRLRVDPADPAR